MNSSHVSGTSPLLPVEPAGFVGALLSRRHTSTSGRRPWGGVIARARVPYHARTAASWYTSMTPALQNCSDSNQTTLKSVNRSIFIMDASILRQMHAF